MPEDPFGDLGAGSRGRREPGGGAAQRLQELDSKASEDERAQRAPEPPRPGGRYTWVVGVAAALVIVVVAVNSLPNAGRGYQGPEPGTPAPAFAAPSASGELQGDANVRQEGQQGADEAGALPACQVHGADIVTVCGAPSDPLVVTFVTRGCEEQLDVIEGLRRGFPDVRFVGVFSGRPLDEVKALDAEHAWGFPLAVDADRAVFNLYRAGDCPTTTFVLPGGEVKSTRLGPLPADALTTELRALQRAGEGGGA